MPGGVLTAKSRRWILTCSPWLTLEGSAHLPSRPTITLINSPSCDDVQSPKGGVRKVLIIINDKLPHL